MERLAGLLPGGWWDDSGRRQREVEVRPLTGREEQLLSDSGGEQTPAAVTMLLSACLLRLGDLAPVPAEVIRRLPVGDRDYLLLLLRRVTFGDRVRANLFCPWEGCAERVTIDVLLSDLPTRQAGTDQPVHVLSLSPAAAGDGPSEIGLRLPDGSDQEELTGLALSDEAAALSALLARVVRRIGADELPPPQRLAALSSLARAEVETELERIAPGVEHDLEVRCAGCGRGFIAPLDPHDCFFGELRAERGSLPREVHFLAFNYHWSEPEIMAMSRPQRQTYIDLLAEEIEGMNGD